MSQEGSERFLPRNPGCKVGLYDIDIENSGTLPACMGGTALGGCNNADTCLSQPQVKADLPEGFVRAITFDEDDDQAIRGITIVQRADFTLKEVEAHQTSLVSEE